LSQHTSLKQAVISVTKNPGSREEDEIQQRYATPTLYINTVPGRWICEHHQRHWLDQWKTWRKSDY